MMFYAKKKENMPSEWGEKTVPGANKTFIHQGGQ